MYGNMLCAIEDRLFSNVQFEFAWSCSKPLQCYVCRQQCIDDGWTTIVIRETQTRMIVCESCATLHLSEMQPKVGAWNVTPESGEAYHEGRNPSADWLSAVFGSDVVE
jgi:hypothetical protein